MVGINTRMVSITVLTAVIVLSSVSLVGGVSAEDGADEIDVDSDNAWASGSTFWQGNDLVFLPDAVNASVANQTGYSVYEYSSDGVSGPPLENIAFDETDDGAVFAVIDTSEFDDRVVIAINDTNDGQVKTDRTGKEVGVGEISDASIEIVAQEVELETDKPALFLANGTAETPHVIDIMSNRASYDISLESPDFDVLSKMRAVEEADGKAVLSDINSGDQLFINDLEEGVYRLDISVADTTVEETIVFEIDSIESHQRQVELVDRQPTEVRLEDTGEYWIGTLLNGDNAQPNDPLDLRRDDGTLSKQLSADEAGNYSIKTDNLEEGGYFVSKRGEDLVEFTIKEQSLSVTYSDESIKRGDTAELRVVSDRDQYDLIVWVEELSTEQLIAASDDLEKIDNYAVADNISGSESIRIDTSDVEDSQLTTVAVSSDTAVFEGSQVQVADKQTETPTPTETTTPTVTPDDGDEDDFVEEEGAGFESVVALAALLMSSLLAKRYRI